MILFSKGRSAVLEKPLDSPQTKTETERSIDPRTQMAPTANALEDSSITVVENPIVNGHTGLVLAQHFEGKTDGERHLVDVHHLRIDQIYRVEVQRYDRLVIRKGFDNFSYEFIVVGGNLIPSPSTICYKGCFLDPKQYEMFRGEFEDDNPDAAATVELMYELLAKREPDYFSLERGELRMPANYASLRPSEIRLD